MGKKPNVHFSEKERQEIQSLARLGMRDEDIAHVKDVSIATLKRHCRKELSKGRNIGKATILNTAFQMATSGNHPAVTIFLCKTRCGLREVRRDDDEKDDGNYESKKVSKAIDTNDPIEVSKIYQKIMSGS